MDKAAVLRASQHGVGLLVRYEGRYPTGPNGERLPSFLAATDCTVTGSAEQRAAALADLRNFMTPATEDQAEAWLAEMSVTVAKRAGDDFTEELRLSVYASRLRDYPADIAKKVLREYSGTFWPSWGELAKSLDAMTGPRRQMIAALMREPENENESEERISAERADAITKEYGFGG